MSLRRWVGAAWAAAGSLLVGVVLLRGWRDGGGFAVVWGSLCAVLGLIAPGIAFAWTEE